MTPLFGSQPLCESRSWWTPGRVAIFVLLIAACAFTRLYDLGQKAIMHDESLFVYYTEYQLHREFSYFYQPILHGPAMLWIQAFVFWVFGVSDYTMRLGAGLLGIGGFFWIWSMRRWIGQVGIWVALAFYTLSPTLMFYQRFFRNDGLFLFATLWIVASAAWWWHTRGRGWGMSLIFAITVLFCNKESSLFIYFGLGTFLVMLILHDLILPFFDGTSVCSIERKRHGFPSVPITAGFIFLGVTLILTRIFEGISYDADVVQALGNDFVLHDVNSIPIALGYTPDAASKASVYNPWTWRFFYGALLLGSVSLGYILQVIVEHEWGRRKLALSIWQSIVRSRHIVIGSLAGAFLLYMILFTTGFKNPMGPFEIYKKTLQYWMGQNAMHRIRGPFHMHLVNLLVYELPLMLGVLGGWLIGASRIAWRRITPVSLLLAAGALAVFHVLFFFRIDNSMSYFMTIAIWTAILGFAIMAKPEMGRVLAPVALIAFIVYSAMYFNSLEWTTFFNTPVFKHGTQIAPRGVDYMDRGLSVESGMHLFLIAFLILMGTVLTWHSIDKGARFQAYSIWWLVTMIGACSYAREKVPWVGIHITLPLVLLMGIYAQKLVDRWRLPSLGWKRRTGAVLLGIALIWTLKTSNNLCFRNYDDVRERMIFGHTTSDVKHHVDRIYRAVGDASIRTSPANEINPSAQSWDQEWSYLYNDRTHLKDVRVAVLNVELEWPLRWYLRDVEWSSTVSLEEAVDSQWPFIFLDKNEIDSVPELREQYYLYTARNRMHWVAPSLDWKALADIWKGTIPRHNRVDGTPNQNEYNDAKKEWANVWNYMIHRDIFDKPGNGLSMVDYVFAVRKDSGF